MTRESSLADIFQIGYYWETKILLTAVKLDLFSALKGQSLSVNEVADALKLNARALELVMNALVAMRVLTKEEKLYANTPVAERHLVQSSPEYVGHLLLLHDAEWSHWGQLEQAVRTGRSPVTQHVFETNPDLGAHVLTVLDRIGQGSGQGLAKAVPLQGAKRLLDIGGGAGTNAIAFCLEHPKLSATVFDLPQTLKVAKQHVERVGLESRIHLQGGNFHVDAFQGTYDLALMSDILHYQDGMANAALVKKVYACLNEGGRLIIKDRFLDPSKTSPAWTTAFAVHILVNTECGECFTTQESHQWLEQAGFRMVEELEPGAMIQGTK
ncbi:MAG: methyltransferase domain-containing protein [Nitrospira sp.]|nr:methyltransferase domain-containing protein [Nitrospira sp.]